jgi:shikimate kinase
MKNIVLIGFMGTGKSRVGHMVARKLRMRFVDTDDIIVQRLQMPITEIFARIGEPRFREMERQVVAELSDQSGLVIATGGGVPLDETNVANLKRNGIVICLSASPEVIFRRTMRSDTRPLLRGESRRQRIRDLLDSRQVYYAAADHQIDTTARPASAVAREIVELYRADGKNPD